VAIYRRERTCARSGWGDLSALGAHRRPRLVAWDHALVVGAPLTRAATTAWRPRSQPWPPQNAEIAKLIGAAHTRHACSPNEPASQWILDGRSAMPQRVSGETDAPSLLVLRQVAEADGQERFALVLYALP
jgi:hypothetical protein